MQLVGFLVDALVLASHPAFAAWMRALEQGVLQDLLRRDVGVINHYCAVVERMSLRELWRAIEVAAFGCQDLHRGVDLALRPLVVLDSFLPGPVWWQELWRLVLEQYLQK